MLGFVVVVALAASPTTALADAHSRVVLIATAGRSGSGFLISTGAFNRAWFLTNRHVVEGNGTNVVVLNERGGIVHVARAHRVVLDSIADLALVEVIDQYWSSQESLRLHVDPLPPKTELFTIGFPYASWDSTRKIPAPTFSRGSTVDDNDELTETTAYVNPGNSGGPAVSATKVVVGVVTMKSRVSTHSFIIPIPKVIDFVIRAGVEVDIRQFDTLETVDTAPSPVGEVDGVASLTIQNQTLDGVLIQPKNQPDVTYLLYLSPPVTVNPEVGATVRVTVNANGKTWEGPARVVNTSFGATTMQIERLENWPGARLAIHEPRAGDQVWAKISMVKDTGTRSLPPNMYMVSRTEQSTLGMRYRWFRLDAPLSNEGVSQGVVAINGVVIGVSAGWQSVAGVFQFHAVAQALPAPSLIGTSVLSRTADGRCEFVARGVLGDPMDELSELELRLTAPNMTVQQAQGVELIERRVKANITSGKFELRSAPEPCAAFERRGAQIIARSKQSLFSPVFSIALVDEETPLLPPGWWTHAESVPPAIDEPVPTAPPKLKYDMGRSAFFVDKLPRLAPCQSPSIIPSRGALAWGCRDGVHRSGRNWPEAEARWLAFSEVGEALLSLRWGALAILKDGRLAEVPLFPGQPLQPRFVRALKNGFLVALEPTPGAPELYEVQWKKPPRRVSRFKALPTSTQGLSDKGEITAMREREEADVSVGQPSRPSAEAGETLLRVLEDATWCRPSMLPRPGDAHFNSFDVLVSAGEDVRFFHHSLLQMMQTLDSAGTPIIETVRPERNNTPVFTKLLQPDYSRVMWGQCQPVVKGTTIDTESPWEALGSSREQQLTVLANGPDAQQITTDGAYISKGHVTPLPFGAVVAARWSGERFLLFQWAKGHQGVLWELGSTVLRNSGQLPEINDEYQTSGVDVAGRVHVIVQRKSKDGALRTLLLTATPGAKRWIEHDLTDEVRTNVWRVLMEPVQ